MSQESELEYPELLELIAGIVGEALEKNGSSEQDAARIAYEAAETVRRTIGGHQIYLPKGKRYELSQRDLQIWNDFNGRNIHMLARKHDLTVKQIYAIIAKVRLQQSKRVQPDFFDQAG
ncbi:MAG TPA: Mor transcription activator family protein [Steroidobacteraceae bacterium]|nr:Mor transcription activator family protein [Steroidobacteraceae bacterium]